MWNTFAVAGESITRAVNGSIRIYKNNSITQRSSAAGITDTEDFDAQTGLHHLNIDLSNNTDAGFYAAGNDYMVTISAMTIDGKVINAVIAEFSIENRNAQANLTRIDGLALVAATLNLLKLNIVNTAGDAVVMSSTGGNGNGLLISGNGNGEGMKAIGGINGNGIEALGGSTTGAGIKAVAVDGIGIEAVGGGGNAGLKAKGGSGGPGIAAEGGATSGAGISARAPVSGQGLDISGAGGGNGILAVGQGAGDGMALVGGATGSGLDSTGLSGIRVTTSDANGDAVFAQGNGAGKDVRANIFGSIQSVATDGITAASIAADAVTEIQSGLATSVALAAVQADTDDIQTRLPATLSGGKMRSQVEGMDADVVTAAALAADAGAEIAGAVIAISLTELAAIPGASPALGDALQLLYMALRNELDTTAVTKVIKNQAGVVIGTATLSDDLVTFRKTRYT
jgi:hypothetical protein